MATKPHQWRPDRRPVRAIDLYNGAYSASNPWGLKSVWLKQGVPWLCQEMDTAYQTGFRRFMWSLPAGRAKGRRVDWPSAQWQVLNDCGIHTTSPSSTVHADLASLITPWLSDRPDVQIIIYLGGVIKSPTDRDVTCAWIPDPANARDRRIMHANFDGFVALSPNRARPQIGFWFDNSSPADKRDRELAVVEWLRGLSIWAGMEAVTNDTIDGKNLPKMQFVRQVPMFGLRQFFDVANRAAWRFDPDKSQIGFFLAGYSHSLSDLEGRALLKHYHEHGFILGTYSKRWESTTMSISGH
jgi:hypothetical protein